MCERVSDRLRIPPPPPPLDAPRQGDIDYDGVVKLADGFNAADLRNVCTEAGMFAIRAERDYVIEEDFMKAVRKVGENKKLEVRSGMCIASEALAALPIRHTFPVRVPVPCACACDVACPCPCARACARACAPPLLPPHPAPPRCPAFARSQGKLEYSKV